MRAIVCFALAVAVASCGQFQRYDGGDDDDVSSRDDNVATDTVADADAAAAADTDAAAVIVDTSAAPDADAPDAPDAVADSGAADSGSVDSGRVVTDSGGPPADAPADVPAADSGCGGFVGARCCPGTGALSRCGDDWLGCYGGTCQCGAVGQVCCHSPTEITCHGGFRCGPAFTCI